MKAQVTKRANVTVDDRRRVIVLARARKPAEQAKVNQETFVRQQLKAMLGWGPKDPAPQSIKDAAKEMAGVLFKEAMEKAKAAQPTPAPKGWDKVEAGPTP